MNRSRLPIVVLLLASFVGAWASRDWALAERKRARPAAMASGESLSRMNSYSLVLLLGGLRGPLVMMLWTSSEAQKHEKRLEDFDTKVEWIRLLQPEFDSVHMFQIWNKAYNISAQMASLSNKYRTILDALSYATDINKDRPDNLNLVAQTASVYFDKFGSSQEKHYYRARVRRETQAPPASAPPRKPGTEWRPVEPMLDARGDLLESLVTPTRPRPADIPADSPWNDGSEFQYLKPFAPFPNGVSPYALAYNYFKKAQVLYRVGQQHHSQMSDYVIDSRAAIALRYWVEEELEWARRLEIEATGKPVPLDRPELDLPTARATSLAPFPKRQALTQAIASYRTTVTVAKAALAEFEYTSRQFRSFSHDSHVEEVAAWLELAQADADYLDALSVPPDAPAATRPALLASAKAHYNEAVRRHYLLILHYFFEDEFVASLFPAGYTKATADQLPTPVLADIVVRRRQRGLGDGGADLYRQDRLSREYAIRRATERLAHLP